MKKSQMKYVKSTIEQVFARIQAGEEKATHELNGMMELAFAMGEIDLYNTIVITHKEMMDSIKKLGA